MHSAPALSPITADALSAIPGVRHGFFTRAGGVSTGIYAGLNCGLGSSDDPKAVLDNRARAARHLGATDERIQTLHQVHSAAAYVISEHIPREHLPQADGLATNKPGIVIGVLAADCCPVLFADPEAGVVGAAHAGWRGALSGVLKATIATMEGLGGRRERIVAALGPCIGQQNYEVGLDFVEQVLAHDPDNSQFLAKSHMGKSRFDLPGYVEMRLSKLGIRTIERQSPCTYADDGRFYSYRRATHRKEPDYGRQISAIVLR
ncbi:MAG: peptidoglycan editing factor PgeF [Hyphomicrobiaceae bacterium]|nr:peptidoglycan editing factor PgeF [Hyphomicrobiaceae bacterium]